MENIYKQQGDISKQQYRMSPQLCYKALRRIAGCSSGHMSFLRLRFTPLAFDYAKQYNIINI